MRTHTSIQGVQTTLYGVLDIFGCVTWKLYTSIHGGMMRISIQVFEYCSIISIKSDTSVCMT